MRAELKRLQQELGLTFVHVTHSQEEAMALADMVVVMSEGRIEQAAPPRDVYNRPATRFVARFIGGHNVLEGRRPRAADADGLTWLDGPDGARFAIHGEHSGLPERVSFAVRTDRIQLRAAPAGAETVHNVLPAAVSSVQYQGTHVLIGLEGDGLDEFNVALHESAFFETPLAPGDRVVATWSPGDAHVLG